jgi:ribosomal-protein-serine acetyltransferase
MFTLRLRDDLELGLLEQRHAEELFALVDQSRDYLREWLPWLDDNQSMADTQKFIQNSVEQFANNGSFTAGILYQGKLTGCIGFHHIDRSNRATSIGYWLGASFQGKGLMTEACRGLVEYAFKELNLNRVQIRCATENQKSRAIPERLGFRQEGILRQAEWLYDHYVDLVIYGMLASDRSDESARFTIN